MHVTRTPVPSVLVDEHPTTVVVAGPGEFRVALDPEAALLPDPFPAALTHLALSGAADATCALCGRPVGLRLDDNLEMTVWHPVVLTLPAPEADVVATCPACAPPAATHASGTPPTSPSAPATQAKP